ncbi:MAG TPA: sulfurtransferase [Actinomycetota bacterium]|nr:sulfurtransferase [Actinomycetota bacterium]
MSTTWLSSHLNDPTLVVVDMRWREDGSAPALYERGHIPGAVFLDWATDIVEPDHPIAFTLASPDRFREAMERCGIGDESTVVAYSDQFGSGPHRLWWACRLYGHDQVLVLDGGLEKWRAEGRPLSNEPPHDRPRRKWTPAPSSRPMLASAVDVLAASKESHSVVVDARPAEQFLGEAVWFETGSVAADPDGMARTPRGDFRAGRVPWATNIPAADLYANDFTMKPPEELRELFTQAGVEPESRAITYCGAGIAASAVLFGLVRAGFEDVALYDASWEEWGRDRTKPIARGP